MGDRRNQNAQNWATATSLIPIFGGNISQGILQRNLARQQQEQADKLNPVDPSYTESQYAKEQLALARNAMNSRMPGSVQAEANIARNQSNIFLNLARAAGSPQAMIAGAGALQNSSNNALSQLAAQEAQYKNSMLSNLNNALIGMVQEGGKVYADQLRKYTRDFDQKQNLLNSSQQNFSNSIANASSAMDRGIDVALKILSMGTSGLPQRPDIQTFGTNSATPLGNFNPAGNWFTPPAQATYTPSIYGRP